MLNIVEPKPPDALAAFRGLCRDDPDFLGNPGGGDAQGWTGKPLMAAQD